MSVNVYVPLHIDLWTTKDELIGVNWPQVVSTRERNKVTTLTMSNGEKISVNHLREDIYRAAQKAIEDHKMRADNIPLAKEV